MTELVHGDLTYAIIGAAMEVHRELGPGFLESIYQKAMESELRRRAIAFEAQKRIGVSYKGEVLAEHVLDLVVDDKVVVELKAAKELVPEHEAQILSYLKASGLIVGLLINFAKPSLEHKRILLKDSLRPKSVQSV
jgi:GxxExxY protein